jgi:hypothetical protein
MRDTDRDMSDSDNENDILKNEDTLNRRAWVARALDSARRRLASGEPPEPAAEKSERPQLYVVSSNRPR